jgi:hypothetical protein
VILAARRSPARETMQYGLFGLQLEAKRSTQSQVVVDAGL